jgi:hypothetical protein
MKPSNVDYNTLPLPPIPDGSSTPSPRRILLLLDGLMDELLKLQVDVELTPDDPT